MTSSSATGRFWICPQCQKHVPMRIDGCACGFDRTTVPVKMREAQAPHRQAEPSSRGGVGSFALGALCMALLAIGFLAWNRQSPTETGDSRRLVWQQPAQPPPTQPQIIIMQGPSPTPSQPAVNPGGMPNDPGLQIAREVVPLVQGQPSVIRVDQVDTPRRALPDNPTGGEIDSQREHYARVFEGIMQNLSHRAINVDASWIAFEQTCSQSRLGGRNAQSRGWFTLFTNPSFAVDTAGTCPELFSKVNTEAYAIHRAIAAAEDDARRHWVDPGTIRDIRRRYNLEY